MAKQRKRSKRLQVRSTNMRLYYSQATTGAGSDHTLELVLNGGHKGHLVKAKVTLELYQVVQLAGQLHAFVASEQRKVTQALNALRGNNPNGEAPRP